MRKPKEIITRHVLSWNPHGKKEKTEDRETLGDELLKEKAATWVSLRMEMFRLTKDMVAFRRGRVLDYLSRMGSRSCRTSSRL